MVRRFRRARGCTQNVSNIYLILFISVFTDYYNVLQVPNVVLGTPIKTNFQVNVQLTNQLTKYFGVTYGGGLRAQALRDQMDMATLVRFGHFRLAGNGDKIRTADIIVRDPYAHDNSFVRVCP